jgi:hypothetical protein
MDREQNKRNGRGCRMRRSPKRHSPKLEYYMGNHHAAQTNKHESDKQKTVNGVDDFYPYANRFIKKFFPRVDNPPVVVREVNYEENVNNQPDIFMDGYSGRLSAINRRQQDQHRKIEQNFGQTVEFHFSAFPVKVV